MTPTQTTDLQTPSQRHLHHAAPRLTIPSGSRWCPRRFRFRRHGHRRTCVNKPSTRVAATRLPDVNAPSSLPPRPSAPLPRTSSLKLTDECGMRHRRTSRRTQCLRNHIYERLRRRCPCCRSRHYIFQRRRRVRHRRKHNCSRQCRRARCGRISNTAFSNRIPRHALICRRKTPYGSLDDRRTHHRCPRPKRPRHHPACRDRLCHRRLRHRTSSIRHPASPTPLRTSSPATNDLLKTKPQRPARQALLPLMFLLHEHPEHTTTGNTIL